MRRYFIAILVVASLVLITARLRAGASTVEEVRTFLEAKLNHLREPELLGMRIRREGRR